MSRSILSSVATAVALVAIAAAPGSAFGAQGGLTGDPWIDQYIEQVPTAGGGKPTGGAGSGGKTGLTRTQITNLVRYGGDRFAATVAASVAPIGDSADGTATNGKPGTKRIAEVAKSADKAEPPTVSAALIQSLSGSDGGLGPILPAALIGSLIGAIALAASRIRRTGS